MGKGKVEIEEFQVRSKDPEGGRFLDTVIEGELEAIIKHIEKRGGKAILLSEEELEAVGKKIKDWV